MTALEEAQALIYGDRRAAYGNAADDFAMTGALWTVLLGSRLTAPLTAHDVALMMALLKIRREAHQHKRDNVVDGCGYLALAGDIAEGR